MAIIPKKFLQKLPFEPQSLRKQRDKDHRMLRYAEDFEKHARAKKPAPAAEGKYEEPPNFIDDPLYGLVAKYYAGWDYIAGDLLAEGAFFSLPHILETYDDLDCSILLASRLYYKQAIQVLRNFLETSILHLYFIRDSAAFDRWKQNEFRTPSVRGKKGMLAQLQAVNWISNELALEASDLYSRLNGAIHGSENRMINRGAFTGDWKGMIFQYDRYEEWCRLFAAVVQVGIQLLLVDLRVRGVE